TARIDYVELPGGEIAASKRFYSAVFGWQFKDWGPDYADSADAGTGFGLNAGAEHRPAHPFPVVHVDDLEAALAAVRRAGGAVTKRVRDVMPGLVFAPRQGGSVYRLYRDIRFSRDKRPYKTHVAALLWDGVEKHDSPGVYLHVSPEEVIFGGGIYLFEEARL